MSFAKSFFTPRKSYKFCPEKSTCLFPKVRGITSLHYTAVSVQCDPWLLTMLKLKISYALKLPTWKRQHYPPTGPTFSLKNLQIQIYSSVCIYIKMYKQHVQTAPLKGTQDWDFFWLRFWNLYYFFISYVKILRFYKKHFLIRPLLGEIRFFRLVWD